MHLINVQNLKLEEFHNELGREYAILSHRWERGEVSYQDMQCLDTAKTMDGFAKILKSCQLAKKNGLSHVWVDTCCINKESSAELSEAINSMYRWYAAAKVCYAFLSDVRAHASDSNHTGELQQGGQDGYLEQKLKKSMWFTRGWTLQELLAPCNVEFFDQQWTCLGTRCELSKLLTVCTGIPESILLQEVEISSRSIAERMSWASRRSTTRIEDTAYCLIGIFDVNMPLLYGEGEKAFLRLQEEVIKQTDDHSIFAWPMTSDLKSTGLLANNPTAFKTCQSVRTLPHPRTLSSHLGTMSSRAKPHTMTNRGLSIRFMALHDTVDTYLVRLNCTDDEIPNENASHDGTADNHLGIFIRRLSEDDQYFRIRSQGRAIIKLDAQTWDRQVLDSFNLPTQSAGLVKMHIRQNAGMVGDHVKKRAKGIRLVNPDILHVSELPETLGVKILEGSWDPAKSIITMEQGRFAILDFAFTRPGFNKFQLIMLGFDLDWNPICYVQTGKGKLGPRHPPNTLLGVWSDVRDTVAKEIKEGSGTDAWNLRGDRLHGINVKLESRYGSPTIWASVRMWKEFSEHKVMWNAQIEYL